MYRNYVPDILVGDFFSDFFVRIFSDFLFGPTVRVSAAAPPRAAKITFARPLLQAELRRTIVFVIAGTWCRFTRIS